MRPVALGPNRPPQFYRSGRHAAGFRGGDVTGRPEEWLASVTTRFGSPSDGLTRLPDGRLLRDAIAEEPARWLGAAHVEALGADPALLVKLLDAGERLPVHVHPTRDFALQHLASQHGKTEAWVVLGTDPGASVWLGFARDVTSDEVDRWVRDQDVASLLGAMHRLAVGPGDGILVPAGTPHAIGAGVFCLETQEPTDFSLNLEWEGFALPPGGGGQLGLPYEAVLECVQPTELPAEELERLRVRPTSAAGPVAPAVPASSDPYFRVQRVRPAEEGPVRLPPSYAVLVTVDGEGTLLAGEGPALPLRGGDVHLVPWASGPTAIAGAVEVLRCLPPRIDKEIHHA